MLTKILIKFSYQKTQGEHRCANARRYFGRAAACLRLPPPAHLPARVTYLLFGKGAEDLFSVAA